MTEIDLVRLTTTTISTTSTTELCNKYIWGYSTLTAESETLKFSNALTVICIKRLSNGHQCGISLLRGQSGVKFPGQFLKNG